MVQREQIDLRSKELVSAIKRQEASGDHGPPNAEVRRLTQEIRDLMAKATRTSRRLQRLIGIPNSLLQTIEEAKLPTLEDRFLRHQVEDVPSTENLDETAATGLRELLKFGDRSWLDAEARKPYRLGSEYLRSPLHLVAGTRLGPPGKAGPQRFARMLLVCQDHVDKRADLDFFAAAMLVPEVAALGNNIDILPDLGPEAQRKLSRLHEADDEQVASTVYELLVGLACLRRGRSLTMLPADLARKSPDYRVHDLGPLTGAIECKRRLGLSKYEAAEAQSVELLYAALRAELRERGLHGAIEASFGVPVSSVEPATFRQDVLGVVRHDRDTPLQDTSWGQLGFSRLAYSGDIATTRLYSADYLERVFGWPPMQVDWDGLLCEVEPPDRILIDTYRDPLCLKWRSESADAMTKKARGVRSMWAEAAKQIPAGEIGIIYLAYPEGARTIVADARTQRILDEMNEVWHRPSIRIPMTVIARLYPRSLRMGMPDLIESTLPGVVDDFWLTQFPSLVFEAGRTRHA